MVTVSNIVSAFRTLFGVNPTPTIPTTPTDPAFAFRMYRLRMSQRGLRRQYVGGGSIHAADAPSAALALAKSGQAHAGESIEIDGNRYRVWNTENGPSVSLIDPTRRAFSGDRRRHREALATK